MKTILFLFNKYVWSGENTVISKNHQTLFPTSSKVNISIFFLHTVVEMFRFLNYLLLNLPLFHLRDAKVFLIIQLL